MNDPVYKQLRELSWRRKLTEAEEVELHKYLAEHPEAKEDWELEGELNHLLEQLPEAPAVASNFTARVLKAVEMETATQEREHVRQRNLTSWRPAWSWLPKMAVACLVLGLGSLAYHQQELNNRRLMVKNVAEITDVVSASDPEMIDDFESIRRLSDSPPKADTEMLALMK
ncbi:MAG: hypothetical protein JWR26_3189 [Pedosphaera sp.]|nr:hypothetical protein [Pedosphaera sp.]